jgi:hypothetical protein
MGLVGSFFSWHFIKIFPLQNIVSGISKPGTIPAYCERTAKVGEKHELQALISQLFTKITSLKLQMTGFHSLAEKFAGVLIEIPRITGAVKPPSAALAAFLGNGWMPLQIVRKAFCHDCSLFHHSYTIGELPDLVEQ